MSNSLYSISISARATLDMHSLNNEGGEGNQIQTRMVNIVDQGGRLQNVNAINGDMYKHIQSDHLIRRVLGAGLPICAGCREFNANRINADKDFLTRTADLNDADLLSELLRTCAVDDMAGILITEGKRSVPRKSVVEFGWVVGVPEAVTTDSYFHVKYANERSEGKRQADRDSTESTGSNLGQAIFHRPASSGIYAAICHIDLARIGFNDITQTYAISPDQRALRAKVLLESVLFTFLEPNGAMRTTQAPHLVNFEGVVSYSTAAMPAPTVSPLKDVFRTQVADLAGVLNRVEDGAVGVAEFDDLTGFGNILTDLMGWMPYAHQYV